LAALTLVQVVVFIEKNDCAIIGCSNKRHPIHRSTHNKENNK